MMKYLTIETPYGTLIARSSSPESEYPGFAIYLQNNEKTEMTLLTVVEYSPLIDKFKTIYYEDSLAEDVEPEIFRHVLDKRFTIKE